MTQEELINQALPKWPQMLVTGKSVTVEQAKEIIFRTDDFLFDTSEYSGGNNHAFNREYQRVAGLDRYTTSDQKELMKNWKKLWRFAELVRERAGFVGTQYVKNCWASCSFIWGAHGWCSPQGRIHFIDNVGKWPTIREVLDDWQAIAQAFPYLNLVATLMSGEGGDEGTTPIVNIVVKDGTATLEKGDVSAHRRDVPHARNFDDLGSVFSNSRKELGLPGDWYDEYAKRVSAITNSITDAEVAEKA